MSGRGRRKGRARILFVTGTDTGVGKTVLTCLLLAHLRREGVNALGLKPFCSGGREDAEAIWRAQGGALGLDEVNPFYFDKPVAPRAAAGRRSGPSLETVVNYVERMAQRCDVLLIEGAGGILVPLGRGYTVADLIRALDAEVLVVGRNALGTINHSLLTLFRLETLRVKAVTLILMGQRRPDASAKSNLQIMVEMAPGRGIFSISFLGNKPLEERRLKKSVTFLQKTLAQILDTSIVSLPDRKGGVIESR